MKALATRDRRSDPRVPGHPVRAELAVRGISQRAAASLLGISAGYLNGQLTGRWPLDPAVKAALVRLLCMPEDRLFHPEPDGES